MQLFTEGGVWLQFQTPVRPKSPMAKYYAKTPLGEYAFSDTQGLYEWTKDSKGELVRIAYTGGDRQASDKHGRWTVHGRPEPNAIGIEYALSRYNCGVN